MVSSRLHFWAFGFCCLFAVVLYCEGLPGSFIFDDAPAFADNPLAKVTPLTFDDWRIAAQSSNAGPLGRPVSILSLSAHHAMSGAFLPEQVKLANIFIHVMTAVALYFWLSVMLQASGNFWPRRLDPRNSALIASAIWVLHPLHVSTVLYSVQRMAQLSTFFVFVGLAAYCHYRVRWAARGAALQEVVAASLWLGLVLWFAIMSKENGVLLLWLIPLVEMSVFRGAWNGRTLPYFRVLTRIALALPLILVAALLLFMPDLFVTGYEKRDFSMLERVLTQLRVLWHYVGWTVWPAPHLMGFQHDDIVLSRNLLQPWSTLLALLAWGLISAAAVWYRRTCPVLLFCVLFYLIGHSMESSVIALEMVYEHRNYLPSIAVCLLLAMALQWILSGVSARLRPLTLTVAISLFAVPLFLRASEWSDDFSLARVNVERHPESLRSHYFYSNALLRQYRQRESLDLDDKSALTFIGLGRESLLHMLALDPENIPALVMLHYIDSRFFSELAHGERWSERAIAALDGRPLESSDWNALNVFAECLGEDSCESFPEAGIAILLDKLRENYQSRSDFLEYQLVYERAARVDSERMLKTLDALLSKSPRALKFYPYAIEQYSAAGDLGGLYRALTAWMRHDSDRLYISQQKSIFGE